MFVRDVQDNVNAYVSDNFQDLRRLAIAKDRDGYLRLRKPEF